MEGNIMTQKQQLQEIETFQVSKQEHDILRQICDLEIFIHPDGLDYTDYNDSCGGCRTQSKYLLDAYEKAACSFKLILQQILINNDLCHLNHLLEKFDKGSLMGFSFEELIHAEGRSYIVNAYYYAD